MPAISWQELSSLSIIRFLSRKAVEIKMLFVVKIVIKPNVGFGVRVV